MDDTVSPRLQQTPPRAPRAHRAPRALRKVARGWLRLHRRLRTHTLAARFTVLVRLLLALAFLPSGARKVLGLPFTILPETHPVGAFFHAFFAAPAYYAFVGAAQVLAAILLLVPRTALLGALLFLPIVSNIVVITWSMEFQGTPLVAASLLLANLHLLVWDGHRLAPLLGPGSRGIVEPRTTRSAPPGLALGLAAAAAGAGLAVAIGLATGPGPILGPILLCLGAMLLPLCLAGGWEAVAAVRARRMLPARVGGGTVRPGAPVE